MFNSQQDYISWVKGGELTEYFEESAGYIKQYYRVSDTSQLVSVTFDGVTQPLLLEGSGLLIEASRYIDGVLTIVSTDIYFGPYFLALAVFLALTIDWQSRIMWSLYAVSDVYTYPFTLPVFSDSLSISWEAIPSDSLSGGLSSL
jgi:hypothetical protein